MRTTVTIEDELFEKAALISNQTKPSRIIAESLSEYVERENAERIAAGYLQSFDKTSLISVDEMSERIDALLLRKRGEK